MNRLRKYLYIGVLGLAGACSGCISGQQISGLMRLIEISNAREKGVDGDYTEREMQREQKGFEENMAKIKDIAIEHIGEERYSELEAEAKETGTRKLTKEEKNALWEQYKSYNPAKYYLKEAGWHFSEARKLWGEIISGEKQTDNTQK